MGPLDPKAELMRLADALVDARSEETTVHARARAALSSAITIALAAERRRALEEAASLINPDHSPATRLIQTLIRQIDGKAGGPNPPIT